MGGFDIHREKIGLVSPPSQFVNFFQSGIELEDRFFSRASDDSGREGRAGFLEVGDRGGPEAPVPEDGAWVVGWNDGEGSGRGRWMDSANIGADLRQAKQTPKGCSAEGDGNLNSHPDQFWNKGSDHGLQVTMKPFAGLDWSEGQAGVGVGPANEKFGQVVSIRANFEYVGDIGGLSVNVGLGEHAVEFGSGVADEWLAVDGFIKAGGFAD